MKITDRGIYEVAVYTPDELKLLFKDHNVLYFKDTHTIQIGQYTDGKWYGQLCNKGIAPHWTADTPGKAMGQVKRFIKREQIAPC
jgi:hypothetical protein